MIKKDREQGFREMIDAQNVYYMRLDAQKIESIKLQSQKPTMRASEILIRFLKFYSFEFSSDNAIDIS